MRRLHLRCLRRGGAINRRHAAHSSWIWLGMDYFRDGRALRYGSKRFEGIEEHTT
jgi:hypothetical protein